MFLTMSDAESHILMKTIKDENEAYNNELKYIFVMMNEQIG